MSKQHLLGKRWRKAFKGVIGTEGFVELRTGSEVIASYTSAPFDTQIRCVCKSCNEGWMEVMERASFPVCEPMAVRNLPTSLDSSAQLALANWAVETALMMDRLPASDRYIPQDDYPTFNALKRPLESHTVWIGRIDPTIDLRVVSVIKGIVRRVALDPNDASIIDKAERSIAAGQWIYLTTFNIGYLVFQVMGHNLTTGVELTTTGGSHGDVMSQVWPYQGVVEWPPSISVDAVGGLSVIDNDLRGITA